MSNLYIPYHGKNPALLHVNGHPVIILAQRWDVLEDELKLLGADRIEQVDNATDDDTEEFLVALATRTKAGIVIAPDGARMSDVIQGLQAELPWLH
jgi:hypothetical protein